MQFNALDLDPTYSYSEEYLWVHIPDYFFELAPNALIWDKAADLSWKGENSWYGTAKEGNTFKVISKLFPGAFWSFLAEKSLPVILLLISDPTQMGQPW